MWSLGPPVLSILLSLLLNRLASGRVPWRSPGLLAEATVLLLAVQVLCLLTAASARPGLAALLLAACAATLWGLDAVKRRVLREPLVFSDVGLLSGVLRNPEFYFPHLPLLPALGAALATLCLLAATLALEPPTPWLGVSARLALLTLGLLPGLHLLLAARGRMPGLVRRVLARHPLSFDPLVDVARFGPALTLVLHLLAALNAADSGARGLPGPDSGGREAAWPKGALRPLTGIRPHLLLVQAESFCDLRRRFPQLPRDLLTNFDAAAGRGLSGRFAASCFGAYTMRTEFATLSGLPPTSLGAVAYDPYLFAASRPAWSLAWHLRGQGYAALALHPNDPRFFRRGRVLPRLGFERFLSVRDFAGAPRFGPYVSDEAMSRRVLELLAGSSRPCFCFAITMEAHGPWLSGRLKDFGLPEAGALELYSRHLQNADCMLGLLLEGFARLDRPVVLGLYGDHMGSLPGDAGAVQAGGRERWTDYLVWSSAPWRAGERRDLRPEELGGELLEALHAQDRAPHRG